MLQITKAGKQFGQHAVFEQLDLTVASNQILGLAGPSGSGKSTLLRCIQGLDKLDQGFIHCAGKSSFMFQDFQLFPHMNVLTNLTYAPIRHDKHGNHQRDAMALLNTLGLQHKAQAFPSQLSGGQKQRVALARSLMMRPDLLLCDEPTSGLDAAAIDDVLTVLSTVKNLAVTMIIASHDLDFLTRIADRIVVLKAGRFIVDIQTATMPDAVRFLKTNY